MFHNYTHTDLQSLMRKLRGIDRNLTVGALRDRVTEEIQRRKADLKNQLIVLEQKLEEGDK